VRVCVEWKWFRIETRGFGYNKVYSDVVVWLRNKHKCVVNINKTTDDAVTKLRYLRRHS